MILYLLLSLIFGFFGKWFLKKKSEFKLKNLQILWNATPNDVVVLHLFPRGLTCPSISPFVLKLETFLRMHGIKYVTDFKQPLSPKGKCPWITINGVNVSDSQLCIEYLAKKFDLDANPGLTPVDLAISRALRILVEEDWYNAGKQFRWVINGGRHLPNIFRTGYPEFVMKHILIPLKRIEFSRDTYAQGMGRHTR